MIYVIGPEDSAVVKIGHTANKPSFRLGNLQIGNPEQLVVRWAGEGDETLEKHLHAVFKDYRVRGEWFDLSPLGDPVQAVKDEMRKASERLATGESLLAADRFRVRMPRSDRKAFDQAPDDEVVWDPEVPPAMRRGRAIFLPTQRCQAFEERFPAPTGPVVAAEVGIVPRSVTGHEPKPGCIRGWQGQCMRPMDTTCDC